MKSKNKPENVTTSLYTVSGHRYTFQDKPVKHWVESKLEGRVLNATAGPTRLDYGGEIVTNDINTDLDVDYHHEVKDLPRVLGKNSFDTVILDPPWSVYQANERYNGRMVKTSRLMHEAAADLVRGPGRVIEFGYNSSGLPARLQFPRVEVAIFEPIGPRKSFFGVVCDRSDYNIVTDFV